MNKLTTEEIQVIIESGKKTGTIDFSYKKLPRGFDIINVINVAEIDSLKVSFKNCEFHEKIELRQQKIDIVIDFTMAKFCDLVAFENCTLNAVIFTRAHFLAGTAFDDCTLNGCKFDYCLFDLPALFIGSLFSSSSPSGKRTVFDNAIFYGGAFFTNSNFANVMMFRCVVFKKTADFSYNYRYNELQVHNIRISKYFDEIIFHNCIFDDVRFTNRHFTAKADFSLCEFKEAPKFYGCTFHQHTIFPAQKNFKDVSSKEAASAYRVIYNAMSELKVRHDESMFYALMQKSERKSGRQPFSFKIASWLYEKVSDFSQSIGRPLIFLLVFTMFYTLLYTFLAPSKLIIKSHFDWSIIGNGFSCALQQIVRPFSFYSARSGSFVANLRSAHLVMFDSAAITQSVISFALVALFILSLRWKFKKD